MGKFVNLKGQIFGTIQADKYLGNGKWDCHCIMCGSHYIKRSHALKTNGCKECWKNHINNDYFKSIDSNEKAYWLGLLWADGYCDIKSSTLKLDVQEGDKEILEKMKKDFKWTGHITSYTAKLGKSYRSKESSVYRICIKNKEFIQNIYDIGVRPHREKSHLPEIENQFMLSFIKGYFDGNGSVSIDQKGRSMATLCGGTILIKEIGYFLENEFGITSKYYYRRPENPDNITLVITKKDERMKFLKLLLQTTPIGLERKKEKMKKILEK